MTEPVPTEPTASTPEPVLKAAAIWGSLATVIVTLVGVGVAVSVLSSEQASLVTSVVDYVTANIVPVGTALLGIFTLVSGGVASFATALVARRHVTPVPPAVVHHHEAPAEHRFGR